MDPCVWCWAQGLAMMKHTGRIILLPACIVDASSLQAALLLHATCSPF
jgi:hypothetical protein